RRSRQDRTTSPRRSPTATSHSRPRGVSRREAAGGASAARPDRSQTRPERCGTRDTPERYARARKEGAAMSDDNASAPSTATKLVAEALGTFLLVFGSLGAALFATNAGVSAEGSPLGIGYLGVALAFGLTVMAGIYAWGPVSGGHFNPAVTFGLAAAGRFEWRNVAGYVIAQIVGGAVGTTLLVLIGLFGPNGWLSSAQ